MKIDRGVVTRGLAGLLCVAVVCARADDAAESTSDIADVPEGIMGIPDAEEPAEPAAITFGGPLGQRLKLTGDWGGARSELATKGLTLDFDTVGIAQGVVDGGVRKHDRWGGSSAFELNANLDQMGVMPGAFITLKAEAKFGQNANGDTGTLLAPNADALFPMPLGNDVTLTSLVYMQFLSEQFGLYVGKLETVTGGDLNEFAHGAGENQFMNAAFIANPVTMWTVPYSALGAGAVIIPNENILWTVAALDTEGEANRSGFDTVFDDGTTLTSEIRFATKFFERPGHILLGGTWSNEVTGFEDRLRYPESEVTLRTLFGLSRNDTAPRSRPLVDLLRRLPRLTEEESWTFYANFDQFLYVEDADSNQGIALFGRFGLSDGDPNLLHHFYSVGIGGKGIFPGRDNDTFGLGYFYADVSGGRPSILSAAGDGKGVELFYNIEITPWLHITPDVQVLMPGSPDVDTTWVLGLRTKITF